MLSSPPIANRAPLRLMAVEYPNGVLGSVSHGDGVGGALALDLSDWETAW